MISIARTSRFDLTTQKKKWSVAGILVFSILTEFVLIYEWLQAYSADTQLQASRLGWVLLCVSFVLFFALIELLLVVCWRGTDMNTKDRIAEENQVADEDFVPSEHADPVQDGCSCCYRASQSENARHVFFRRQRFVRIMIALDIVLCLLLICSAVIISITRLAVFVLLVFLLIYNLNLTYSLYENANFWFASKDSTDVVVLCPPELREQDIQFGWKEIRNVFTVCIVCIFALFMVQLYYMFFFKQTLIESQRLYAAGVTGYYEQERMKYEKALLMPPAHTEKIWLWVWDGLPCEYIEPLPHTHMQCLEVFSPDTADTSWYTLATGIEPDFLGRQFSNTLMYANEDNNGLTDTEVTTTWQKSSIDFCQAKSIDDVMSVLQRSLDRLLKQGNDSVDFAITHLRMRAFATSHVLFLKAFEHFSKMNTFTLIITASHSQSMDSLQRFGGIVPSYDFMRRFVPWFIYRASIVNDVTEIHMRNDTKKFPRQVIGTTADVYPTMQAIQLQPLSVYSTGKIIQSTLDFFLSLDVGQNYRGNTTYMYENHLINQRETLIRHATFSSGVQSTNEIMDLAADDDAKIKPTREQMMKHFDDWLSELKRRYVPITIIRNVLVSILVFSIFMTVLMGVMTSRSLRSFILCNDLNNDKMELFLGLDAPFGDVGDLFNDSLSITFLKQLMVFVLQFSLPFCIYTFFYKINPSEQDFSLLHVDGSFNGLMVYSLLVWITPTTFAVIFHTIEHRYLRLNELNPLQNSNGVIAQQTGNVREAEELLPIIKKETNKIAIEMNVYHYLTLHSYMLLHLVFYGILWCLQAGYTSPMPLVNPSWFTPDTAIVFTWYVHVFYCLMFPHSVAVIIRAYMFEPRMYATKFDSKPENNIQEDENTNSVEHEVPVHARDFNLWERMYVLKKALART